MKSWALIFLLFCISSSALHAQDCDDVPAMNQKIVQLARAKMKKKVGRGECWDLAEYVLTETAADWDHMYVYGRLINPKKECVLPGDIIQFENVKVRWKSGNTQNTTTMAHHTAIVTEIVSKDEWTIIHQNTDEYGKRVGESPFYPNLVVSGKMMIYRPVRNR
jgi:hypothetical protein